MRRNGVAFYTIPLFEDTGLVHAAYSTREGGVSTGKFESLNFSIMRGDSLENVRENYHRLAGAVGFDPTMITMSKQIHGDDIHIVTDEDIGRKIINEEIVIESDALMTDRVGVTLVKFSADCGIIYLLDVEHRAIALIHSGWRSTVLNIVGKTVSKMKKVYGSDPTKLLAAVGPCIGSCCFEVGDEVVHAFEHEYPNWPVINRDHAKPHIDLWACLHAQLKDKGIQEEHIAMANLCTACDTKAFFSHRKQKGECGLMVGTLTLL